MKLKDLVNNKYFYAVSLRESTVPSPGSPCRSLVTTNGIRHIEGFRIGSNDVEIDRVIKHKTGDRTAVTPYGYFKFWINRDNSGTVRKANQ